MSQLSRITEELFLSTRLFGKTPASFAPDPSVPCAPIG